ncbi:MAG: hypothetical protein JWN60_2726 [Acidobacteria bacterium]|nr:hypothetical protein [Acidobacteriota bacterium]
MFADSQKDFLVSARIRFLEASKSKHNRHRVLKGSATPVLLEPGNESKLIIVAAATRYTRRSYRFVSIETRPVLRCAGINKKKRIKF